MSLVGEIRKDVQKAADPEKAKFLQRFFKTGKGEYAEGDVFLGLTVPQSRAIVKKYAKEATVVDAISLLQSKIHEERLIALLLLIVRYKKGTEKEKKEIYRLYLKNTRFITNWDLVDLSAGYIVGEYLFEASKHVIASRAKQSHTEGIAASVASGEPPRNDEIKVLEKLARSSSLWERRIAIMATFAFIMKGEAKYTLAIAELLLHDKEDLIHKAVGWMLREVGKRISQDQEEVFLKKHYKTMPRTMLRYAIERFPEEKRKAYLFGTIAT